MVFLKSFPRWRPVSHGITSFHPVNSLRSRKRIQIRLRAQFLPHRIPPNVTSNILNRFVRPQNVIVVAPLPKPTSMRLTELERRTLLEPIHKSYQVADLAKSFRQKMEVIGHRAIRMKTEFRFSRAGQQFFQDPFPGGQISKKICPPLGANRNEINAAANVKSGRQPQTFLVKRHPAKIITIKSFCGGRPSGRI
jgi:hypothetical protein